MEPPLGAAGPPLADPRLAEVAIVRLRVGLGDLLCTVPALRSLRRARPDVRVTLVTWAEMEPLVRRMSRYVDALLPFPGYPGIPERPVDGPGLAAFLGTAPRFDLAVQAYGDSGAAREVTERLGRRACGFGPEGGVPGEIGTGEVGPGDGSGWWLPYPRSAHEIWRHLLLVRHLGVPLPPDPARPEFPELPADRRGLARLARWHGLRPGRYAVVHPGATSASRRWPAERFAAVADGLVARGLRVLIGGVAAESALAAEVRAAMRGPATDLTGRADLGTYAALLRRAALLVCADTGVAHLAAATGTPSVTVFLSGDPRRWAYGGRHLVARSGVGCSPCPHLTCPIDFRCATRLPVSAVLERVDALPRLL
ncbi:glycosyltransferase family 9 protein [Microtetraspora fusca]|uniref:glycosyltransferase family 9 protein n=1 Tax=Microtetraspora fusca TaxID=1997 RepID=UPI00083371E4|nr:glycosyltransferase family 9 protein [Microtetraspora fusca]